MVPLNPLVHPLRSAQQSVNIDGYGVDESKAVMVGPNQALVNSAYSPQCRPETRLCALLRGLRPQNPSNSRSRDRSLLERKVGDQTRSDCREREASAAAFDPKAAKKADSDIVVTCRPCRTFTCNKGHAAVSLPLNWQHYVPPLTIGLVFLENLRGESWPHRVTTASRRDHTRTTHAERNARVTNL